MYQLNFGSMPKKNCKKVVRELSDIEEQPLQSDTRNEDTKVLLRSLARYLSMSICLLSLHTYVEAAFTAIQSTVI